MAIAPFDSKTIDELQELVKLTGSEKFVVSIQEGTNTKKVSTDTIVGYAAEKVAEVMGAVNLQAASFSLGSGTCLTFIEAGKEIPIEKRSPGCFYLEEQNQTSIRTRINVPTSVRVSKNLGLKRV